VPIDESVDSSLDADIKTGSDAYSPITLPPEPPKFEGGNFKTVTPAPRKHRGSPRAPKPPQDTAPAAPVSQPAIVPAPESPRAAPDEPAMGGIDPQNVWIVAAFGGGLALVLAFLWWTSN